ncbi:hypothetical protein ACI2TP_24365 [Ralstonia nicotianae]
MSLSRLTTPIPRRTPCLNDSNKPPSTARLHTDDFATSRSPRCDGFTLAIHLVFPGKRDAWAGVFERGDQRLEVIRHLE